MPVPFRPQPDQPWITGLGVISSMGVGVPEFAQNLRAGRSGVRPVEDESVGTPVWAPLPELPDTVAGLPEQVQARLAAVQHQAPPATAAAVLAAAEAAVDARLATANPERIGVIVAGSNLTNRQQQDAVRRHDTGRRVLPRHAVQLFDSDVAASVSETLGLFGETWTAGAASASGALAIAQAYRAVRARDLEAVVVVGAPMLLTAADLSAFVALGALYRGPLAEAAGQAATSSRPFDRAAAGFVYGEAAAALVVEAAEPAARRGATPHSVLDGVALRSSATRSPAPDRAAEAAVMAAALRDAGVAAAEVGLINAHATASQPGDLAEAGAIAEVFGKGGDAPRVNATKALTGHCLTSAGVLETIATVVQLEQGWLHPNPHLADPIAELSWVGGVTEPWAARYAVMNSFGFGGLHASLVLGTA